MLLSSFSAAFKEVGGGEAIQDSELQEAFSRRFTNARYWRSGPLDALPALWSPAGPGIRSVVAGWIRWIGAGRAHVDP